MSYDLFTALMLFAFVSSITPGPNNLMLMNSGASFGFRPTIPHLLGVVVGFTLMIILVGLGVMQVFIRFPLSYDILKVASVGYLLYLAYKIALSPSTPSNESSKAKPLTFIQASLFQWVNPKAWTMALTAISIYAPSKSFMSVLLIALIFGLINLPCIGSWIVLGQKTQKFLTNKKRLKAFNYVMAFLLLLSLYPAF
jgi:threonine/homoserine/homoserine lactone efflux protein